MTLEDQLKPRVEKQPWLSRVWSAVTGIRQGGGDLFKPVFVRVELSLRVEGGG